MNAVMNYDGTRPTVTATAVNPIRIAQTRRRRLSVIARVMSAISTWMLPSVNLRFVWIEACLRICLIACPALTQPWSLAGPTGRALRGSWDCARVVAIAIVARLPFTLAATHCISAACARNAMPERGT